MIHFLNRSLQISHTVFVHLVHVRPHDNDRASSSSKLNVPQPGVQLSHTFLSVHEAEDGEIERASGVEAVMSRVVLFLQCTDTGGEGGRGGGG